MRPSTRVPPFSRGRSTTKVSTNTHVDLPMSKADLSENDRATARVTKPATNACFEYPSLDKLKQGLISTLLCSGSTNRVAAVFDRQCNMYASSYPSEIIKCILASGRVVEIFCKYGGSRGPLRPCDGRSAGAGRQAVGAARGGEPGAPLARSGQAGRSLRPPRADPWLGFTEGFDTPDLKDARALLDELA
jgi:hypothetical protein